MNTWTRTEKPRTFAAELREFVSIAIDALFVAWILEPLSRLNRLRMMPTLLALKRGRALVLESYKAFNRSVYHLHEELEFAVPRGR